jgi:hypothetical protein
MSSSSGEAKKRESVFSEDVIKNIANCTLCLSSLEFHPDSEAMRDMRRRNCENTNLRAPLVNDISVVYLAETPPHMNRYIYRSDTPVATGSQSLAGIILEDLRIRNELDPNWKAGCRGGSLEEKEKLLQMLKSKGILVLDCCHCYTGIVKSGRRRKYVRKCFANNSEKILKGIISGRNVEVRTCYYNARRMLERKKSGFEKTRDNNVVANWRIKNER